MSFSRRWRAGDRPLKYKGLFLFLLGIACALLLGWIVFPLALYRTEPQPLSFSHKVHTGDPTGMTCDSCHELAEDGRFQGIPSLEKCAVCHAEPAGTTAAEKRLVEEYVKPQKEIPWKVYSRQPDNAYFSHAAHIKAGKLKCEACHGSHGQSETLRPYQVNRISGYSRDIWGPNISGIPSQPWQGMKMDRCLRCHAEKGKVDGCISCHK
jgi:menaquinone reductase, multiheme cytochrome c subunit